MDEPVNDVCPHGPFKVSISVYVVDDDGSLAEAKYDLVPGKVPTAADVVNALRSIRQTLRKNPLTMDFRFMRRHEFVGHLMSINAGRDITGTVAIPGPNKFTLDSQLTDA